MKRTGVFKFKEHTKMFVNLCMLQIVEVNEQWNINIFSHNIIRTPTSEFWKLPLTIVEIIYLQNVENI